MTDTFRTGNSHRQGSSQRVNGSQRNNSMQRTGGSQRPNSTQRPGGARRPNGSSNNRARMLRRYKKLIMFVGTVLGVIVAIVLLIVLLVPGKKENRTDKQIVLDYVANQEKEYTDEEKIQITTAYKNMLETEGEEATDMLISQDDQTAITLMGMSVNVYVFRDFKNNGYLNGDNSFIDVEGYKTIAGFDVDANIGADGFANLEQVDIVIDNQLCTTVDLRDEIASFRERFEQANVANKTTTIYGVDMVDVDENTRLYITYLDVQYDDSWNITSLRVSGHLLTR